MAPLGCQQKWFCDTPEDCEQPHCGVDRNPALYQSSLLCSLTTLLILLTATGYFICFHPVIWAQNAFKAEKGQQQVKQNFPFSCFKSKLI